MTPAARVEATIELLSRIDGAVVPADWVMAEYMRGRRYIGSKDRRAIGDFVYAVLRRRARLDWWMGRAGPGPGDGLSRPRRSVIAALALVHGRGPEEAAVLFDGAKHHPAPLGPEERAIAEALAGKALDHAEQPLTVRGELPAWLLPRLRAVFGDEVEAELAALRTEAPVDLRTNSLKCDRAEALDALAEEGIATRPTPLSPLGLRVEGRPSVNASAAFARGLVEIQDEGSQIVALLADARPGMSVVDYCAGAGGKTLALAATMENRGRLIALDVEQRRLDRAAQRLRRAGVGIAERRLVRPGDAWLTSQGGRFDRVLVDAPCSGSGAWRRNPDARWRLDPDQLAAHVSSQSEILDRAARLVRRGGRLIYATCSLLPDENARRVADFLARRADFRRLAAEAVWRETLGAAPDGVAGPFRDGNLFLTPARHGTDGFFAAVLERAEA